jgi:hypothetical protein
VSLITCFIPGMAVLFPKVIRVDDYKRQTLANMGIMVTEIKRKSERYPHCSVLLPHGWSWVDASTEPNYYRVEILDSMEMVRCDVHGDLVGKYANKFYISCYADPWQWQSPALLAQFNSLASEYCNIVEATNGSTNPLGQQALSDADKKLREFITQNPSFQENYKRIPRMRPTAGYLNFAYSLSQ